MTPTAKPSRVARHPETKGQQPAKKKKRAKAASKKRSRKKKPSPRRLLIRGGHVIAVDEADTVGRLDVLVEDDRIAKIGTKISARGVDRVIDAKGMVVIPGFVQAHVHLCQTLFRAMAENVPLLDWLREIIWPLEGALEPPDLAAAADLGIAELLLGGTTSILDMGTVRHTDVLFERADANGIRYAGGKTIMDFGQGYPAGLRESTEEAIAESVRLCERWHGQANGRLRYAFSPRFALSASDEAMRACIKEARARGALLHTHAAENPDEVQLIRARTNMGNVEYLHSLGFVGADVVLAHGIWMSLSERKMLAETGTRIAHCPSANLKLASGIARVTDLLGAGVHVALGTDGAACNNTLDAFEEMRLASLLHKVRGGPDAIGPTRALRLATRDGAKALGLDDVGSIEVGHKADLIVVDLTRPHTFPTTGDLTARVVFSARASDVRATVVDGEVLVEDGALTNMKLDRVLREADEAAERVKARV